MRTKVAVLCCGIAVGGCSISKDMPLATAAAARFHNELNAGQVQKIYAETAPAFKAASSSDKFLPILTAIHHKLGAFRTSTSVGWNDTINTGGHFLSVRYKSQYEHGEADESFTFAIASDRAAIAGYNINSMALIVS